MSMETGDASLKDVKMADINDSHTRADQDTESSNIMVDSGSRATDAHQASSANETPLQSLELDAHLMDTEHSFTDHEGPISSEKSSDVVVPASLTSAKETLLPAGPGEPLALGVDPSLPHLSRIEIRLQEDSADAHSTETRQTADGGSSNPGVSRTGPTGNPDAGAAKDKIYTVLYSCNKCSFCSGKLSELKLHAQAEQHEDHAGSENEGGADSGPAIRIDYACGSCPFKTKRLHTYREHLLTHAKIGAKAMFKCMDCDYTTRHKYNLKTHLKRHAKIGELCEDEVFRCPECDYVSPYKHDLMTHVKKHEPQKPFQCDRCDFQSIYKHSLIHHVRSKHERLRPFKCDQCDYSSARKQDLQTHMGRHAEEKRFKCDRCSYATPYRVSFRAHMDRHMGNKLFKCEQEGCDFATTTKQNLKSHELRHSTDKPLKCAFCDYTAAHKQQMVHHDMKHGISDPPSKTYSCISCDYKTAHRYSLQRHMNRHKADRKMPEKAFVCEECGYSTGYKNSLKRHMAKHSDVKPFKCGHCDYSAINMTQMHVHIAKHTGIKPFKCDACDYATANKQHLVGHMAKHSTVRLNCTQCSFSTAWKQRLRAHVKAHEAAKLEGKAGAVVETGKVPGSRKDLGEEVTTDVERDNALNEISNAIEAFHSYSMPGGVEVSSSPSNRNPPTMQENGQAAAADGREEYPLSQPAGDNKQTKSPINHEQVQLVDEDGNKVSAALQCINGEQSIQVLVGSGQKKTVTLKDLQKGGPQVLLWEQTEAADGTQCIRSVSPPNSRAESESDMALLVIDEMKAV